MSADFSSVTPGRRVSIPVLLLVYLGTMLFGLIVVTVVYLVAAQFFTNSSGSSAMGAVIPMIAAMGMAGFWAKREGRPAGARQWGVAFLAAILTIVLNGGLVWYLAVNGLMPEIAFNGNLSQDDLTFGAIILGFFLVLLTLVIRGGFWLGFNGWEKQQKKLREAAGPPR